MNNPIKTALDFLRVLLDAIRNPEERGGQRRSGVSTPVFNECANCAERDGKHVVGCPKGGK